MLRNLIRYAALILAPLSAFAQDVATPAYAVPKSNSPIAECIKAIQKKTNTTEFAMSDGSRIEFMKISGKLASVRFFDASGNEVRADPKSASRSGKTDVPVPDYILRSDMYTEMKAKVKSAFKGFVSGECMAFATKVFREQPSERGGTTVVIGGKTSPGLMDVGGGYYDWGEEDFEGFIDDFVADDFDSGERRFRAGVQYDAATKPNIFPLCATIVNQCRDFCGSMGNYEQGGCGGLGVLAGLVLTPGIGIAVGAYCGGKVWVASEQCKQSCNIPSVPCR